MLKYIFLLILPLLIQPCKQSFAQLDLDSLMPEETAKPTAEKAIEEVEPQENTSAEPETAVHPSDTPDKDNFMVEYFNEVDAAEAKDKAALKAQSDAYRLMNAEPTMVTIPEEQQKLLQLTEKRRKQRERELQKAQEERTQNAENSVAPTTETKPTFLDSETEEKSAVEEPQPEQEQKDSSNNLEKAPFGLYWGISKEKAKELGFVFQPAKLENQTNVFVTENPEQLQKQFATIVTVFGEQNHLSAIYAEGKFEADTPQAENVLKLYDRYYAALKKKYGNDKEYFKANTYEEKIEVPNLNNLPIPPEKADSEAEKDAPIPKTVIKTVKKDKPRGNDDFLQELQKEKASLFATFGNTKIKVTLAVEANDKAQSRITLDYENLSIRQQDKEAELNDLMDDL